MSTIDEWIMMRKLQDVEIISLISLPEIDDWKIYTQDGPSDETLLISKKANVGIFYDEILTSYRYLTFPLNQLSRFGWKYVGKL